MSRIAVLRLHGRAAKGLEWKKAQMVLKAHGAASLSWGKTHTNPNALLQPKPEASEPYTPHPKPS